MKHIAKVGLTYPVGNTNIARAKRGDMDKVTEWKHVEPGEVVDDIPEVSVPWLLRAGRIEAVDE